MTELSIIVTAYNLEQHIEATLTSLYQQNDKDYELIIINDGSSDGTIKTINNFFAKYPHKNLKVITTSNNGVSSARNYGIKISIGEYIYFLDGDDTISTDFVEKIKDTISQGKAEIIVWGYNVLDYKKNIISNYFDNYQFTSDYMSGIETLSKILTTDRKIWICCSNAAYNKKYLLDNDLNYTVGCINGEDQEFTFKALYKARRVVFLKYVLFFYNLRETSITNSVNTKKFDSIYAYKRVSEYLIDNNSDQIKSILNYLIYVHIPNDFFSQYNNIIRTLTTAKTVDILKIPNYVNKIISEMYPNLINEIRIIILKGFYQNYIKIKYSIFYISPKAYSLLYTAPLHFIKDSILVKEIYKRFKKLYKK